jgi:hypothetical protein
MAKLPTTGQKTISNFTKLFFMMNKIIMYLKKNVCLTITDGCSKKNVWEVCGQILLIYRLFVIQTHYLLILMKKQVLYQSRIRKKNKKKNTPSLLTRFKVYPTESFSWKFKRINFGFFCSKFIVCLLCLPFCKILVSK